MFKFEHLKETIAVFISNAISDHEMNFEIMHAIKHNFSFKLGNLRFNPSYLFAYIKKECNVLPFLCSFIINSIIDLDRNGCMYLFNASRTPLAFLSCSANFRISTHICMADVTLSWADVFASLSFGLITRCPVVSVSGYFQMSCNCLYSFFSTSWDTSRVHYNLYKVWL